MRTLAIISQKGGAGKTTLAVNLAVMAEIEHQATVVIDLDPQASAKTWHDIRARKDAPFVVSAQATRLEEVLQAAQTNGAQLVIIDTAPHSESAALAAARAADLVLIPCRPAILDLKAIGASADLAALAKKPAAVVLNAVPHQGKLADEAEQAVRSYNLTIAPVKLTQRAAYVHSLTAGQGAPEFDPEGKASIEIRYLHKWIRTRVYVPTLEQVRMSA
ncbi:MAG: AAA family ATPase [Candidatus Dormibacteria bacterium]